MGASLIPPAWYLDFFYFSHSLYHGVLISVLPPGLHAEVQCEGGLGDRMDGADPLLLHLQSKEIITGGFWFRPRDTII